MNYRTLNGAICLAVLVALTSPQRAEAGGGFGSVWTAAVTDSSITLNWSDPSGNLRPASSPTKYKICYKPAGAWFGSCNDGVVIYTDQKPYPLTGLTDNESYKIKVFTYTERKNWKGKWKDPEYRKVGTLTQSTMEHMPVAHHGDVAFLGGTPTSISVQTTWSDPADFEFIRTCYKKTWALASLIATCSDRSGPTNSWSSSTAERGWLEVEPAVAQATVEFQGLSSCRQYLAVAYGFPSGINTGTKIGEIKGHTSGHCRLLLLDALLSAYEPIVESYVVATAPLYRGSIADHLVEVNPRLRVEQRILEGDGENLANDFTFIEFLAESHPEVFERWQTEPALRDGLTLERFVETRFPAVFAVVSEEIRPADQIDEIDVSGPDVVSWVVEGFAEAAGFGAHVSTSAQMDGFGGADAECYVRVVGQAAERRALVQCYDGFLDPNNHANEFQLELGPAILVSHVSFTVSRRLVTVDAAVFARSPAASENQDRRKVYSVVGSFPLREQTGFFKGDKLYLRVDGVLSDRPGREGSGFIVEGPVVR